jgi:hypothetical protein
MKHKQYVNAWKRVIRACKEKENVQIFLEWGRPLSPEVARGEFLKALHRRINKRGGLKIPGKWNYEARALRDQAKLRTARMGIIVRSFETKEVRKRFSNLLFED